MQGVLPMVAAAVAGILVGAAMVATRFVIEQTEPVSLALLRFVIGSLCLLPAVLVAFPAASKEVSLAASWAPS